MHSTDSTMSSPLSEPHDLQDSLRTQWLQLRSRLAEKQLLEGTAAALSLRIPGGTTMWHGLADDPEPQPIDWQRSGASAAAAVFARRRDVCAVVRGSGPFGALLAGLDETQGRAPLVFDEQVRHLGRMPVAQTEVPGWEASLQSGGNAVLLDGWPLVLGTTATRLALNAELFEKCAKACVLAVAAGGRIRALPWIVRHVANGRLLKDERRAAARVALGLLPEESKGY